MAPFVFQGPAFPETRGIDSFKEAIELVISIYVTLNCFNNSYCIRWVSWDFLCFTVSYALI